MKLQTTGWSSSLATLTRHKQSTQHQWLYYWAPALLWLALIAYFSTGTFRATNTGSLLSFLLREFHVILTGRQFLFLHEGVRKLAHFTAYGILSALFFRAWRNASRVARWRWTWAILALLVCLITASSDELHQYFTPGRTGAMNDVGLDMTGAGFAQLMIVTFTARKRKGA